MLVLEGVKFDPAQIKTSVFVDKDGNRLEVWHRGPGLSWTHSDARDARDACAVCSWAAERDQHKDEIRAHPLDGEAEELMARGASGQEFAELMNRGWRPKSLRMGSGLAACPDDCGVCHPTADQRIAAGRRARKERKR